MTPFTEGSMLAALRRRHEFRGNGGSGRWAFMTHVRTGAAFDQQEIDAVVLELWPSDGLHLHAFEIKCTRSDWLREIRPDTSKSTVTRSLCDTFTVVAPKGAVHDGELPVGWGLIEASAMRPTDESVVITLRSVVKATLLSPPAAYYERTLPRGLVAAMMRAAGAVPGMTTGRKRQAVPA